MVGGGGDQVGYPSGMGKSFRRDTTGPQTIPTDTVTFDCGHFQSEVSARDSRRSESRRTQSDHDQIKILALPHAVERSG
jgi:hypothetical protein